MRPPRPQGMQKPSLHEDITRLLQSFSEVLLFTPFNLFRSAVAQLPRPLGGHMVIGGGGIHQKKQRFVSAVL